MIKGSVAPINIPGTEKILNQMKKCVCKIKIGDTKDTIATGFFLNVPFSNMNFLMTSFSVVTEEYLNKNEKITISINDDEEDLVIDLTIKREKYFSKEYDITAIEIKKEDGIEEYLEIDDYIFEDYEENYYNEKSIYILHYLNGKNISVSYGILNKMKKHKIRYICSSGNGSLGAPIFNLENNKVIGIHKKSKNNCNKGTLLKYPIDDNLINKSIKKNIILGDIDINKEDINKDIQIINSFDNGQRENPEEELKDKDEYKNEKEIKENIIIKINGKVIEFTYRYKFEKEGKYNIEYLFKKNLTNTIGLFFDCEKLTDLNLLKFNTQNVTNMLAMFSGCESLTNLDLSNFNTQKVTNMSGMFAGCKSLTNLNLSNFNTQNVTNMRNMFFECEKLTNLNLSNFKTEKVTNMREMFRFCESLTNLNLSNFNTQNVTNMNEMFDYCKSLTNLNLSNFNTEKVTDMDEMFSSCDSLKKGNIITKDNKILNAFESK